ncbi:unnamed protein product [Amoebophrya sp. A25]|nr:unnamed protein product [Amoebophrya sp. A25]|eukprot:GSA25T00024044001.1
MTTLIEQIASGLLSVLQIGFLPLQLLTRRIFNLTAGHGAGRCNTDDWKRGTTTEPNATPKNPKHVREADAVDSLTTCDESKMLKSGDDEDDCRPRSSSAASSQMPGEKGADNDGGDGAAQHQAPANSSSSSPASNIKIKQSEATINSVKEKRDNDVDGAQASSNIIYKREKEISSSTPSPAEAFVLDSLGCPLWYTILSYLDPLSLHTFELTSKAIRDFRGPVGESFFEVAWRVCYLQPFKGGHLISSGVTSDEQTSAAVAQRGISVVAILKKFRKELREVQAALGRANVGVGSSDASRQELMTKRERLFRRSRKRGERFKRASFHRDAAFDSAENSEGLKHILGRAKVVIRLCRALAQRRAPDLSDDADGYFLHECRDLGKLADDIATRLEEVRNVKEENGRDCTQQLQRFLEKGCLSWGLRFSDDAVDRRGNRIGTVQYHFTGFAIFGVPGTPIFIGACRITTITSASPVKQTRFGHGEETLEKSVFKAWLIPIGGDVASMKRWRETLGDELLQNTTNGRKRFDARPHLDARSGDDSHRSDSSDEDEDSDGDDDK